MTEEPLPAVYRRAILSSAALHAEAISSAHPQLEQLTARTFGSETWLAHHPDRFAAAAAVTLRLALASALTSSTPSRDPGEVSPLLETAPAALVTTNEDRRFRLWQQLRSGPSRLTLRHQTITLQGVTGWLNPGSEGERLAHANAVVRDLESLIRAGEGQTVKRAAWWGFWFGIGPALEPAMIGAFGEVPRGIGDTTTQQHRAAFRIAADARYLLTGKKKPVAEQLHIGRDTLRTWLDAPSAGASTPTIEQLHRTPELAWLTAADLQTLTAKVEAPEAAAILSRIQQSMAANNPT